MESFDVIIIGAGPAGLKCAETLGGSKLKVLLVERNEVIGPKVCAGGLVGDAYDFIKFPDELVEHKFKNYIFRVNNKASTINFGRDYLYIIDRKNLGQWQLGKLGQFSNIIIRTNTKVSKVENDHIIIDREKVSYKYLVGADGSTSVVRRFLGIKSTLTTIAMHYLVPTNKFSEVEICYEPRLFSAWYAWIFPHKHYVSIGCACKNDIISANNLKSNFKLWLDKRNIDVSDCGYESFIINPDYKGHKFNNIFLIGDAAGFTSSLTGEGLGPALMSGDDVAKLILDHKYETVRINRILNIKTQHNNVLKLLLKAGIFKSPLLQSGRKFISYLSNNNRSYLLQIGRKFAIYLTNKNRS